MIQVTVAQEHIDDAVRRDEHRCMIADAIRTKYPDATHIKVDLAHIRFSRGGKRYLYITPMTVFERILWFDQKDPRLQPFRFRLRHPFQIHQAGTTAKRTDRTPMVSKKRGRPPVVEGGDGPRFKAKMPSDELAKQIGRTREYGRRLIKR